MKRVISILICAVMLFGTFAFLVSAEDLSYNKDCPMISVHGYGYDIYNDAEDVSKGLAYPVDTEAVLDSLKGLIPDLLAFAATRDYVKYGNAINKKINEFTGQLALDKDGNVDNGSGLKFEYPAASSINKKSTLGFKYDWRLDPLEIADELNDFIEYVCQSSGCDKVCINCHSNGGIVFVSYINQYGSGRIKSVIFNSTAIYGLESMGQLMTGNFETSGEALTAFLQMFLGETEYQTFIKDTFSILNNAGFSKFVADFGDDVKEKLYDIIAKGSVFPLIMRWSSLWAMIPDEYVDDAYNFIFDEVAEEDVDYTVLQNKIKAYNTTVRANRETILDDVNENCNIAVFSRYGYSSVPVTKSWSDISDGVIEVKNTSFGATTCPYDETLTEEQLEGVDEKYISPDKTINASTCKFPEKTWFIKNFKHDSPNILQELINLVCYSGKDVTVDTFEKYPRFMTYDAENKEYNPQQEETKLSFGERVVEYFRQFYNLVKHFWNMIFG